MLARKPRRTVTEPAAAAVELLVAPPVLDAPALPELELLDEQPAISNALPATATAPAKMPRIYYPFSIC